MVILAHAVYRLGVHIVFRDDAGVAWLHVRNRTKDALTGKAYSKLFRIPEERVEQWIEYVSARSSTAERPAHNRKDGGSNPSGRTKEVT